MYTLKRAYHMIRMGEKDKHLGRILYRLSSDQPWQEYAFNRVAFGDLKAALTLEVAKAIFAEKGATINTLAASQLADSIYVDDRVSGGTERR